MQHVLRTTTSASSARVTSSRPSAWRSPAIRSESCSFIWHPKVRTKKRRGSDTALRLSTGAAPPPAGSVAQVAVAVRVGGVARPLAGHELLEHPVGDRVLVDRPAVPVLDHQPDRGAALSVDLDVGEGGDADEVDAARGHVATG